MKIDSYVKNSFTLTYIFLLTTALITFIESMRTPKPMVRHILNLETAISLIASYFYSTFVADIARAEQHNDDLNWANITRTRYLDWSMTTPLILLSLSLTLSQNIQTTVTVCTYVSILILDYIMLYVGYLGEQNVVSKWTATVVGFIAMFGLFGIIFKKFVQPLYRLSNYLIFGCFVFLWAMYGVFYLTDDVSKNVGMNILDCCSKCFIGLLFWAYFSKIIVLA